MPKPIDNPVLVKFNGCRTVFRNKHFCTTTLCECFYQIRIDREATIRCLCQMELEGPKVKKSDVHRCQHAGPITSANTFVFFSTVLPKATWQLSRERDQDRKQEAGTKKEAISNRPCLPIPMHILLLNDFKISSSIREKTSAADTCSLRYESYAPNAPDMVTNYMIQKTS